MQPSFVEERRYFPCESYFNQIKLITRILHQLIIDQRHFNCYVRYSSTYVHIDHNPVRQVSQLGREIRVGVLFANVIMHASI